MSPTISLASIQLAPGSAITVPNFSWQDFETLLAERPDHQRRRYTYYQGILEIMSPLARHERPHRIIADLVKAILDSQSREWEDFGSTTIKRPEIAGIEPDTCLYIQNAQRVQGCVNLDLAIYPPPDLAIESDVTSVTTIAAYAALGVPEVWIYRDRQLTIYLFQAGRYQQSSSSPTFPDLDVVQLLPELVNKSIESGTSKVLRELRTSLS
jgi:Uma2 family endonuclease